MYCINSNFRVEVGVQALDPMTQILETDRSDEEIISYALDTLCNICSPEEFEEELAQEEGKESGQPGSLGEQFTEIYLKKNSNVQVVVDLLEDFDFRIRRPAVKLLTHLLLNKQREMQELILSSHLGVSRLMDVLVDSREVLRNDSLLLLIQLTKGNANLQKIVAFENCFDKLVDILQTEGYSDGGIVVEDCLKLMLNLLRNNSSNQTFFREGSYIQRVAPFFELSLEEEEIEVGWSAQKVSNMLHMILVIRTLVSPSNPTHVTISCQNTILSCGLLEKLSSILLAAGIPADILTETINCISEVIRGCLQNQEFFARVEAPSSPPRPALILLLMSMVNEKQPFALRCAVLYCFQCYLHKNPVGQREIMSTLLPDNQNEELKASALGNEVTAGQLLCGGLFSIDKLSNWFSSVALAHGLADQESLKLELLRVQLSTGNEPVTLMCQCCMILQNTSNHQTRIGILMLLAFWVNKCPHAVTNLLGIPSFVPFITVQIGSNEHDELERLGQGLCAFVLGLCVIHNNNANPNHSQEQLYQLIEKRVGYEIFMDKLSEVAKHESYNKALKHPQLKCQSSDELVFDHKFCQEFKYLEHAVINFLSKKRENASDDESHDPAIVHRYKEVIREQDVKIQERDSRINELTQANLYLQQQLSQSQQQIEELNNSIQTLHDVNSVLKAQSSNPVIANGPVVNKIETPNPHAAAEKPIVIASEEDDEEKQQLEKEIKIRDEIIHELEMQLTESGKDNHKVPLDQANPLQIEVDMLNAQVQALQVTLSSKDSKIDQLESSLAHSKVVETNGTALENGIQPNVVDESQKEVAKYKADLKTIKAEQEDLLMLLADQAAQLEKYRCKFREFGIDNNNAT